MGVPGAIRYRLINNQVTIDGGADNDKIIFNKNLTLTGTIDGGAGTDDEISVGGGKKVDFSGATLKNAENYSGGNNSEALFTVAQFNQFKDGTIDGNGVQTITLTNTGTLDDNLDLDKIEVLSTNSGSITQTITLSAELAHNKSLKVGENIDSYVVTGTTSKGGKILLVPLEMTRLMGARAMTPFPAVVGTIPLSVEMAMISFFLMMQIT